MGGGEGRVEGGPLPTQCRKGGCMCQWVDARPEMLPWLLWQPRRCEARLMIVCACIASVGVTGSRPCHIYALHGMACLLSSAPAGACDRYYLD